MKEYSTGSLTTYDIQNQEDEPLKFSSATITTKASIKCSLTWCCTSGLRLNVLGCIYFQTDANRPG